MSASSSPKIAFFGATGGCTNACLAHTLKGGYHAVALARTPSKLTTSLLQQEGITEDMLSAQLVIVKGDATDVAAVKKTLLADSSDTNNLVRTIVSGIGGTPTLMKCSIVPRFTLDNPQITEQTTGALLSALREIYAERNEKGDGQEKEEKPLLATISTTGVNKDNEPKDVPLLMRPMYHTLLAVPHADKMKMEDLIVSNATLFSGFVIVRPSLLMGDGKITAGKGWEKVKTGSVKKPAVGYTIDRADVGEWIFQEIIKAGGSKWAGEKVTLT